MRLSRGMVIRAAIEARLLGRRLLTLDADIAILPAETGRAMPGGRSDRAEDPGTGLLEAAKSLEAGAAELRAARRQFP